MSGNPQSDREGIGFTVERGQVLGLVGESGSGKTVSSLAIMRLLPSPPFTLRRGEILFEGRDLMQAPMAEMRRIRGNEIAMVFQDPMVSLNPAHRVGRQIAESVRLHRGSSDRDAQQRAVELLDRVGIPDARSRATSYPHELSGGMRQRAMLAVALACSPKVLIADEPTTALDVTIQAQILELLRDLRREYDLSVILVTHDLGVVADICDRVLVMYAGQVVEDAPADQLFRQPEHPYTEALLRAMPRLSSGDGDILPIAGRVPAPGHHPAGCRFHPRCAHATELCRGEPIELRQVALSSVRCVHPTTAAGRG